MRAFPLFLLLSVVLCDQAFSQAWPQAKGSGYYQLGFQFVRATEFYEPNGNRIDIPTLGDYQVSFYGEYGLTSKLTAVAYLPFVERVTLNRVVGEDSGFEFFSGDAVTGVADADVGLRLGILSKGGTVASAYLQFGLPIGNATQENGLLTGDGELNQHLGIAVGRSFWPRPAYAQASLGYNNRVNGYSDELPFKLEAGYTAASVWTVIARLRGVVSMKNGVDERLGGTGGLYGNNQQYLIYGFEIVRAISDHVGVSARAEGATLAENILAAPMFGVSVFLKR